MKRLWNKLKKKILKIFDNFDKKLMKKKEKMMKKKEKWMIKKKM